MNKVTQNIHKIKLKGGLGMYYNAGYLNHYQEEICDNEHPLFIGSCGTYHLKTIPSIPTSRPEGRIDYQLIYIASGKAHFWFGEKEKIISAGNMVFYKPGETQHYICYQEEHPEVYWIHFTGYDVEHILNNYMIPQEHVFYSGILSEYKDLFNKIILELQQHSEDYAAHTASLFTNILFLIMRQRQKSETIIKVPEKIKNSVTYFNEYYNTKINIEQYADSLHVSTNYFIRKFKQYMGISPTQYILSLRINKAQTLLLDSNHNINEIAEIVGYENPLYFSRIFKKETGMSPSQYRKNQK